MPKDWWVLAGFLTLCFSCEAAYNYFVHEGMLEWYGTLKKPSWALPGYYWAPMGTFSYACMAIAAWFTWRAVGSLRNAPTAFGLFFLQLALLTLWAYIFFMQKDLWLSFFIMAALTVALTATICVFWRFCLLAALLLIPYLGWIFYATVFNYFVASAN